MRTKAFPERVERQGVSATIYAPKDKLKGYTVGYYVQGEFVRKVRNSYEEAKKLALSVVEQKASGALDALKLTNQDCLVYRRAVDAVKHLDRPLDVIARDYADAVKLLGNESLMEAVRFCQANRARQVSPRMVEEVVSELLENKKQIERSKYHVTDLKLRLTRFAASFRCPIHTIEPADIQEFLNRLKMKPRTRNNFRRAIGTLFHFAAVRGYVSKEHTGILRVEKASEPPLDIQVFSADDLVALLATAKQDLIPALVIGAFAGLRSEEIRRLDWAHIKWDRDVILIPGAITKTRITRPVSICPTLRQWLTLYRKEKGVVCPYKNFGNQLLKLAKAAGVPWKRNGLRHSNISYLVGSGKEIGKVADEAGNSPTMIRRHYLQVVSEAEADAWFAVTPSTVEAWRKSTDQNASVPTPQNGSVQNVDGLLPVLVMDDSESHTGQSCRTRCQLQPKANGRTHEGRSGQLLLGHQANDYRLDAPAGPAAC